ncbi:unnamed protein product [Didymodactylos carnosus]|nr:unnamed protein product [Didymodactylos carnosus]CAF4209077.1 unnamed protein product [Didymodactylos carnosus]
MKISSEVCQYQPQCMYITRGECEEQQSDVALEELFFAVKSRILSETGAALPVPKLIQQRKMKTVAGNHALVFEKLDGIDLATKCKSQLIGVHRAKQLAKSLLDGMKALVKCRTAHLDNLMGNIFYNDKTQKVTFIDFGESATKNGEEYEGRMSQDIMHLVIDCYVQKGPTEAKAFGTKKHPQHDSSISPAS